MARNATSTDSRPASGSRPEPGARIWPLTGLGHLSLSHKLLVILMATSVGALLLAGATITAREIASSRTALVGDLTSLADVVAANGAAALSFRDDKAANAALASLATRRDIARAALVLPDHTVLGTFTRRGEPPLRAIPRSVGSGPLQAGDRLTIVRPVVLRGENVGLLYLECTMEGLQSRIRDVVGSVLAFVLLAALFAYLVSLRLHRVVAVPIERLSAAAQRVSESRDYSVRVDWASHDELGVLTESFNGMMAQIESQEAALVASHELLRQAQKMEAVGQLAGGVAHDFNNLLTAINGYAALLEQRTAADDPRQHGIREIRKAGDRAANLVRQLLAFGRKQTLEPRVLRLEETLKDIRDMLRQLIPAQIRIAWSTAAGLPSVTADPGQVQQAVVNLVVNARDAMPDGGTITIELYAEHVGRASLADVPGAPPGRYVVLSVRDTGVGMTPEVQEHPFEPFFTTKGVGRGTGLGLATVYGIVTQSGGHVAFDSAPGHGTGFRLYFPAADAPGAPERPPGAVTVAGGSETILLVDDEPMVRDLARDMLALHGYHVLPCGGPDEAIALCESHDGDIDLLLTDFMMPGMNGRDLCRVVAPLRPAMGMLIMSGYTDGTLGAPEGESPAAGFVQKPFDPDTLARRVRAALDARHSERVA
jgi:signal transduction histidine kinase/ActR/RegA family two-component response regulator